MTMQNLPAIWPSTLTMRWTYLKRMAIIAVKTGTEGCIAEENSAVVNSMPMNKRNWLPNILQETSRCSKLRRDYYLLWTWEKSCHHIASLFTKVWQMLNSDVTSQTKFYTNTWLEIAVSVHLPNESKDEESEHHIPRELQRVPPAPTTSVTYI